LYNLPKLIEVDTVIVIEGEKCCDVLARYGFVSTTSAGGAKNAKSSDWSPLASKAVTLWPDNDSEGRRYMAEVEQILEGLQPAPRVSILDPAGLDLGDKEDVADFIEQLKVLQKTDTEITAVLAEALKKARAVSIATEIQQRLADITAGRYVCIDWTWDYVSRFTRALLPGTVTLLVGNPGASKSFMALQSFAFWNEQSLRTSLYEVEEDKVFHLTRALAQRTGQPDITDPNWVKENSQLVERLIADNRQFLDDFGRCLYASPDTQPTLAQLAQWIEQQAKTGCRIIGIDPVTSAERGGEPWVVDSKFLQAIKRTATDYRCSIILITHPIKAVSFPDLSQVAGSAAYQRFSQTILWLESHEEKQSKVRTAVGTTEMAYNRTLHILKARNGKGMGLKLAFEFDSDSLTLKEIGLIQKEKK
jgi:5S rRNA maturation endonuclease (ribonuclease M5)